MHFGIFDHMDSQGVPLSAQITDRLRLVEAYDRCGFYAYHLAEHHGTPLGLAPSPSVFMAAIAQRTSRLRFGPFRLGVKIALGQSGHRPTNGHQECDGK